MWTYNQANGALIRDGKVVATGYSGHGDGRNNPSLEREPNVGPIPRGKYAIGPMFDSQKHGPCVMRLFPCEDTVTYGRGNFLIHGDSIGHPGEASMGCVVMPRSARLQISASGDTEFQVV